MLMTIVDQRKKIVCLLLAISTKEANETKLHEEEGMANAARNKGMDS